MRRIAAAALAATTLCGLTLGASTAFAVKASDRPVYLIKSVDVHKSEEWRVQDKEFSDRCKSWEIGDGTSNLGMAQEGTRRLTLDALPFSKGIVGVVDGSSFAPAEVRRTVRSRYHSRPDIDACSPCGPRSEFGPCTDAAPPDLVVNLRCSPGRSRGLLNVWMSSRGLTVGASPINAEKDLARCEEPPATAPSGAMQWRLESVTFPEAPRVLLGMRLYSEHTFRRHIERAIGNGCRKLSGVGQRSCVAYTTVVVVRRIR